MIQSYLNKIPPTYYPIFGLVLFFLFFCTVLYWVLLPENQKLYSKIETLPFQDSEEDFKNFRLETANANTQEVLK